VTNPTQELVGGERRTSAAVFLDRDGVINRRIADDYVRRWEQFEFLPGAVAAIARLAPAVARLVVVTNQAGVGKGLLSSVELDRIHARMTAAVTAAGGRIDAVYACPHPPADRCRCRKPAPGLGERALDSFPDIDPARSVMVGDGLSDVEFGRALGLRTVLVGPDRGLAVDTDWWAPDLSAAAELLVEEWFAGR
jgi:D-glycero-D-manno-heptose 1,7-bisphosphate phosphatase